MTAQNAVALVAPQQPAVIALDEWNQARIDFVIQNYCGGAPPEVAAAFVALARKRRLSPEEKQIYLINRGGKWGPETSIDGYRLIADRTEAYAGSDVPTFGPLSGGHPESASVTVYKIVQGQRVAFTAVAFWDEFCPKGNQAFMWTQMPRHMLAKVAEAQALRKAFPADLSGVYVTEEMQQAEDGPPPARPGTTTVREARPKPKAVAARSQTASPQQVVDTWLGNIDRAKNRERLDTIRETLTNLGMDEQPELRSALAIRYAEFGETFDDAPETEPIEAANESAEIA